MRQFEFKTPKDSPMEGKELKFTFFDDLSEETFRKLEETIANRIAGRPVPNHAPAPNAGNEASPPSDELEVFSLNAAMERARREKDPEKRKAKLDFITERMKKFRHIEANKNLYDNPGAEATKVMNELIDAYGADLNSSEKPEEPLPKKQKTKYVCNMCGAACKTRCSGCGSVYYCSVACQRKDWKNHKIDCKILRRESDKAGKKKKKTKKN